MVFNSISKVNVVDSLFEADIVVHLEWELPVAAKEKFLSVVGDVDGGNEEIDVYRVNDMDGAVLMAGSVPTPVFQNLLSGKETRQDLVQLFKKNPSGGANVPFKRVFRLLGTFFQGFRCEYFPFDVQGLQIKTMFWKHKDKIRLKRLHMNETWNKKYKSTLHLGKYLVPVVFHSTFELTEYRLHRPITSISYAIEGNRPIPIFITTVMVQRAYKYYVENIYGERVLFSPISFSSLMSSASLRSSYIYIYVFSSCGHHIHSWAHSFCARSMRRE